MFNNLTRLFLVTALSGFFFSSSAMTGEAQAFDTEFKRDMPRATSTNMVGSQLYLFPDKDGVSINGRYMGPKDSQGYKKPVKRVYKKKPVKKVRTVKRAKRVTRAASPEPTLSWSVRPMASHEMVRFGTDNEVYNRDSRRRMTPVHLDDKNTMCYMDSRFSGGYNCNRNLNIYSEPNRDFQQNDITPAYAN